MKNAFSVFVFGKYERYLPYYVYSIEKAYPDTDVVIFYNTTLSPRIKNFLLKKPRVKLYEEFYKEYDFFKNYRMYGGGGLTLLRYLIPEKYFKEYQNVYFGDVDIFILKEPESLFRFHEKQAKKDSLPFSNKVRILPTGETSKRLSGLHFVIVKPYFMRVNRIITEILSNKPYRDSLIEEIKRDEELLYIINKRAFKFDPDRLIHNNVPLHGIHFGLFRSGKKVCLDQIGDDSLLSVSDIKVQVSSLLKEKEFRAVLDEFFNVEVIKVLLLLDLQIPILMKVKYILITKKGFKPFRKLLLKIKNN